MSNTEKELVHLLYLANLTIARLEREIGERTCALIAAEVRENDLVDRARGAGAL